VLNDAKSSTYKLALLRRLRDRYAVDQLPGDQVP
jgi:hypothetical protein